MGPEKCPFCGQEIDTGATKCFFCSADLDEQSVERRIEQLHQEYERTSRKTKCPLILKVLAIIIFICIVLFAGTSKRKPNPIMTGAGEDASIPLNAKVIYTGAQFLISNNDSYDWMNVEVQVGPEMIGSDFYYRVPKISAGQTYTLRATELSTKDGKSFDPYKMKPTRFRIRCESPNGQSGSYFAGWK